MTDASIRELHSKAEVLEASAEAPVVRYEIGDDVDRAWSLDGATLLCRLTQRGDPDLLGLGPAGPLRELLDDVLPRMPEPLAHVRSITVDLAGADALTGLVDDLAAWRLMTCTTVDRLDADHPAGVDPVELGPSRHDEATAFLDTHYTSRWTLPGHMPGERWLGYERRGRLVALGCLSDTPAGYPRLGGITVDASARGLGLGRALTSWLSWTGFEAHDVVTLGLDAGNPAAEHLYLDLGFTTAHHWRSGDLTALRPQGRPQRVPNGPRRIATHPRTG